MNDHTTQEIPYGYCACGCGEITAICKHTDARYGRIKGQPSQFINGHTKRRPLEDRFWEKIDKRGADECWPWLASDGQDGYGQLRVGKRIEKAHRISYMLHYGPIPENMEVCHECNNPPCVNPTHLFLGTHLENMRDMAEKGRSTLGNPGLSGETHPNAKLNETQVKQIREMAHAQTAYCVIARQFHVSEALIRKIVKRQAWKHV